LARGQSWKPGRGPTPKGAKGGRTTPKGASGRYTQPIPREEKVSPRWVPFLILGMLISGVGVIIANYLPGVMPGGTSSWYLLVGLGLIVAGFVVATGYR